MLLAAFKVPAGTQHCQAQAASTVVTADVTRFRIYNIK
jgi:hypothetical protein